MTIATRQTPLRGLRTFCVAAEHESFRYAAEKLFITASAVSHQIKNLEDNLGKKLFERGNRSLSITEAGQALYNDIRPLIMQLDDVTSRHKNAETRSALSISVQPFFASELFVPRLAQFRAQHPDIDIVIDTSDESAEKHPANADVSIRVFKSAPTSLAAVRLFGLRLVPVATPAFQQQLKVEDGKIVSDFPVIVHQTRPRAWQNWQQSAGIELPKDGTSLRLDSMIAVARAAERGLGAALVPLQLGESWFREGTLVPLFSHQLVTSDAYYLVCRHENSNDRNVRSLRQWVLQIFDDFD
jgi:LysR family glycine cleavage system transcriptional activator